MALTWVRATQDFHVRGERRASGDVFQTSAITGLILRRRGLAVRATAPVAQAVAVPAVTSEVSHATYVEAHHEAAVQDTIETPAEKADSDEAPVVTPRGRYRRRDLKADDSAQ